MQPTQWSLCANALAAIAAWQVAQWTMTLRRVQGVKLVKQVELLHAGARSGAGPGWNWSNKKWILQSDTINKSLDVIKNTCATSCYRTTRCFLLHLATRRGGRPTAGQPMARPGGRATSGPSSSSRPAAGRAAAGHAGGSSSSTAPGRSAAAGARPGPAGGAGAGRGGPQAVRRQLLRRALRQRRQAQKMRPGEDNTCFDTTYAPLYGYGMGRVPSHFILGSTSTTLAVFCWYLLSLAQGFVRWWTRRDGARWEVAQGAIVWLWMWKMWR